MVGGNIQGDTRILTTSIVMEVSKGNFDIALAHFLHFINGCFIDHSILNTFTAKEAIIMNPLIELKNITYEANNKSILNHP